MKRYNVTIPIAGEFHCEVEVPDNATTDQIFEAATSMHATSPDDCDVEWEFHEHLCEGNMLNASCNDWCFERVKRIRHA